jgi:hypothetical protein
MVSWAPPIHVAAAPPAAQQEEVARVQAECQAHLPHLVDEARRFPQRAHVGLAAAVRAELVAVDVFDAGLRQVAVEGFEVLLRGARAARAATAV